ncbi:unnamed protein product, partial [Soboliphyme baturini]|uniref:Transposase n=1 Tax=Soboliphyme baturini TaxID=241478 RepID=A0A183J823_9BILA
MFVLKEAHSYQPIITLLLARCAVRNGVPCEDLVAEALFSVDTRAKFANNTARRFEQIPVTTVESDWKLFKRSLLEATAECCGYKRVGLPPG